ncbi:MAG: cysteine--tRNA ligase, partial [Candidatus Moranbacteria bacterium]|nr:cysteine--tRNA ligase [Candidatus Moranbacteria bacterium]
LNTAEAIATLHEANLSKDTFDAMDTVFGLGLSRKPIELPEEVTSLVKERQQARNNKDFAKSDELRVSIEALGYEVKDTNEGQKVTKK